jgi:4-hydroxy-tetrahydrodipicolinate synthase
MSKFRGTGVAMITPFDSTGAIDYKALQRVTQHLIDGGVDYLVVQGTTGESATLSSDEKRSVLDFVIEVNEGRLPVVFGVGGNNTKLVCEQLESWNFDGVDGILSVSPYYNKPTQEGIYQHYQAVSNSTDLPIILYNVPGRTASNMSADLTLRLARDFSNIVAVKEASGDLDQIMRIIQDAPDGFDVISGDDPITLPMISAGSAGLISVIGNAMPQKTSDMVRAALNNDMEEAQTLHYQLVSLIEYLFVDGNPAGVKEVMKFMGICDNNVRLPLVPVTETTRKNIANWLVARDVVKL